MDGAETLELARRSIISLGVGDAANQLAEANMVYGLAKIMWAQVRDGLEPRACFIAAPDCTITRNAARWTAGFGYGGKLFYDFGQPAVVLDAKPNACGMLVGGIMQAPTSEQIGRRIERLTQRPAVLDGIEVHWDFSAGNHFIDIFAAQPLTAQAIAWPYVFIIHSACPELRGPSEAGPGLYWDKSPALLARAEIVDTPWGALRILREAAAGEYWEFFQYAADFAARKRLMAAEALFGEFEPIANRFHQGLLAPGEVLLGSHHSLWPEPLPMTLRPDLPSYLMAGRPNVQASRLDRETIAQRSEYAAECLERANILPHGGGYALDGIRRLVRVVDHGPRRLFELERETAGTTDLVADPGALPMRYRGRQVLVRAIEYGLGEPVVRLEPLIVVKA